jgi:flagellar biosynthesis/type III secretory pathway protein FliH
MQGIALSRASALAGVLFAEDFDVLPETDAAEPEVIEPVFTQAEIAAARAEAHAAALAEAERRHDGATRAALDAIAVQMRAAATEAALVAERSAEAIAGALFAALAAALPDTCARHGAAEVAAVARAVLPALMQEPSVTVRVNPHAQAAVAREIARLEPGLARRVVLTATDALDPGDIRIDWQDGAASRNTADVWARIAETLAPLGLAAAPMETAGPIATKELEHAE